MNNALKRAAILAVLAVGCYVATHPTPALAAPACASTNTWYSDSTFSTVVGQHITQCTQPYSSNWGSQSNYHYTEIGEMCGGGVPTSDCTQFVWLYCSNGTIISSEQPEPSRWPVLERNRKRQRIPSPFLLC